MMPPSCATSPPFGDGAYYDDPCRVTGYASSSQRVEASAADTNPRERRDF